MADDTPPEIPGECADNLMQPSPSDAGTDFQPEISRPMLDVHAPHVTIHTWKDFLNHIAAIVVGLLIAVGLEQTVEFFHHRHQREQLVEAIRRDGEANRGYIKDDIAIARGVLDWALSQAAALERAGATGPLILRPLPKGFIGSLDAGVWLSAKASGVTNLLPPSGQNWLEYLADEYQEIFVSSASSSGRLYLAYAALDQVIIGHAIENSTGEIEISALSAAQRLNAVESLRTIAERAREVVRKLAIYDASNEFILSTPLDQLDTPEAGKRYFQIYADKMKAEPAANFTFSSH